MDASANDFAWLSDEAELFGDMVLLELQPASNSGDGFGILASALPTIPSPHPSSDGLSAQAM